jgi:hypothetical protein
MKKLILFIIIFKASLIFSQNVNDTIFMTGGDTIRCKISSIDENSVHIRIENSNKLYNAIISRIYIKKISTHKENALQIVINGNINTLINLAGYENLAITRQQIVEQTKISQRLDSIKAIPPLLSFKISSLIIGGEIPLIIEYRPRKTIGHVLSVGYDYFNPISEGGQFQFNDYDTLYCKGYNIKYGIRFYFPVNKNKTHRFYINPVIFYKQIWINNINHFDPGPHGINGSLNYNYNLYKQVKGGQLIFGYAIGKTFEFYFGFGLRTIKKNIKYTKFKSYSGYWGNFNPNDLPNSSIDIKNSPSIQLGFNWSFPILRRK